MLFFIQKHLQVANIPERQTLERADIVRLIKLAYAKVTVLGDVMKPITWHKKGSTARQPKTESVFPYNTLAIQEEESNEPTETDMDYILPLPQHLREGRTRKRTVSQREVGDRNQTEEMEADDDESEQNYDESDEDNSSIEDDDNTGCDDSEDYEEDDWLIKLKTFLFFPFFSLLYTIKVLTIEKIATVLLAKLIVK